MADQFQIKGLGALKSKLDKLKSETRNKIGFSALRKAAQDVVVADAKARARRFDDPSTPDNIAEAIKVSRDNRHYRKTGALKVSVGVKVTGKNPVYYWSFRELGTEHEPARPFLRPALTENIPETIDVFVRSYRKKIDRMLKKEARK